MATFLYVGQNAINLGHQIDKLKDTLGLSIESNNTSNIFIDDLLTTSKYSNVQSINKATNDLFNSDSSKIHQYIEIIDNQLRKSLESSAFDICNHNLTILADLSTSELTESLLVHVHDYFPHLHHHSIHLASLFTNTGYDALRSIKKVFTSLELCDTVMIRDIRDVVHFFEKENKTFYQQTDIDFYLACDIFSGHHSTPSAYCNNQKSNEINNSINNLDCTMINWPYSVSSNHHSKCNKIIDVRSSLWKYLFYQKKKKLSIQQTGTDSSSVTDQFNSLRAISSNLASLHLSFNPVQSSATLGCGADSSAINEQDPGAGKGGLSYNISRKGKYFKFERCQVPYSLMSITSASRRSTNIASTSAIAFPYLCRNSSADIYSCQEVTAAISLATLAHSSSNTWFDVESLMCTTRHRQSHRQPQMKVPKGRANIDPITSTATFEALAFVSPYALMYLDELCQSSEGLLRSNAYSHM